ncbi:MAG: VacJ family lipoprotein [Gammaproteobacteria bacterium]
MKNNIQKNLIIKLIFLVLIGLLSGCASTQSRDNTVADPDPIEPVNRKSYAINDTLDVHILKPIAQKYADVTPKPVRTSVTNFFDNLAYLNVIINSFLQGKFKQGFSDTSRFLFNSTLGIGGLFDVATDMGYPKHNEDLGQTLATWGVGRGAYLVIPFIQGPDTVRNTPNLASSALLNPLTYVASVVLFPVYALDFVNTRANLLDATNIRDEAALDPYSFTREAYLQRREFLIHDGNPPAEGYDELFEEEPEDEPALIIE